ncbi:MAG: Rpn family recombination-promoting nuclease/putative transposase [Microscillaceae bacterium]|nr:Rpn family recombination-promoting nuclease/putative transposase [Microscillaceae bacterium]
MKEKYINPFTDFGFKKIFGEEANKDLLLDFLNELLKDKVKITDLVFLKTENLGAHEADRKAVYDLYCQNEKGEKFIVELQKAKQKFFKDRSLYYATFAIQEQAQKGEWDYQLQGVYTISIMDFKFDFVLEDEKKMRHDVQLIELETKRVFYDKLLFIYLEMPKFTKTLDELETHYDKWFFLLQNLPKLDRIPDKLKDKIFLKLFEVAEIAKYDEKERVAYQDSLKYYRDLKNVIDTAVEEAVLEAVDNKVIEIAKNSIRAGLNNEMIIQITGLTYAQIESLRLEVKK